MPNDRKLFKINSADNVAVALENIYQGEAFESFDLTALDEIPAGHKISLADIPSGAAVVKYAGPIGSAAQIICKGRHAQTQNIMTNLEGTVGYEYAPAPAAQKKSRELFFNGFARDGGGAGIRNEIWLLPTVGCVNDIAKKLAAEANEIFAGETDGVHAFAHPYGCSQMGGDHVVTQKILAGLASNPNAAGVLVLGLGCENNLIESFIPYLGDYSPDRIKFLNAQDSIDELGDGMKLIKQLVCYSKKFIRTKIPVSELIVGLNCGGSDGFSGITANPLVGDFSDRVTSCGGIAILTEVPEMFGAETILMNRCVNEKLFNETVSLIDGFKNYYAHHGQTIYENPSPGNKQGGISTLEEKSLGCIQKGGAAPVTAVLDYGQKARAPGLNLLNGPGNDIVSNTSLAASGAQIILFTTGRGTPIGGPVPTVKISSNSTLAERKTNWIDFDAGGLLDGNSFASLGGSFCDFVLSVASGETKTKNEINGYRDIAIFKDGVTL